MRVEGAGFRVQGTGFSVQNSDFRFQGSGCRVQGSGFRVQGSGFRVQGSDPRVQGRRWGGAVEDETRLTGIARQLVLIQIVNPVAPTSFTPIF